MQTKVKKYPFPNAPVDTGYCVFPATLEDDPLILFHATPCANIDAIMGDGFKIPDPKGVNGLPSVSFAKRSVSALSHAMNMRLTQPGDYRIFAVCYTTLCRKGLVINNGDIHDYTLDPAPTIFGYCDVPASYIHQ